MILLPTLALPPAIVVASGTPVATTGELVATLQGCFKPPDRVAGSQVTVSFRLTGRGTLQGRPQIASSASITGEGDRRALDAAVLDALRRCTPISLTPAFAASVAGRVLTLRLIGGPPPQGI